MDGGSDEDQWTWSKEMDANTKEDAKESMEKRAVRCVENSGRKGAKRSWRCKDVP